MNSAGQVLNALTGRLVRPPGMPAMMPERITISVDGDAADDEPEHAEAIAAPPAAASAGVEHPGSLLRRGLQGMATSPSSRRSSSAAMARRLKDSFFCAHTCLNEKAEPPTQDALHAPDQGRVHVYIRARIPQEL